MKQPLLRVRDVQVWSRPTQTPCLTRSSCTVLIVRRKVSVRFPRRGVFRLASAILLLRDLLRQEDNRLHRLSGFGCSCKLLSSSDVVMCAMLGLTQVASITGASSALAALKMLSAASATSWLSAASRTAAWPGGARCQGTKAASFASASDGWLSIWASAMRATARSLWTTWTGAGAMMRYTRRHHNPTVRVVTNPLSSLTCLPCLRERTCTNPHNGFNPTHLGLAQSSSHLLSLISIRTIALHELPAA